MLYVSHSEEAEPGLSGLAASFYSCLMTSGSTSRIQIMIIGKRLKLEP